MAIALDKFITMLYNTDVMKDAASLASVVSGYRAERKMSLRDFAAALNASLINTGISRETVRQWEASEPGYEPDMHFLFECLATYRDWRATFAGDCLRAMYPDLVGTRILIPERNAEDGAQRS